MPALNTDEFMEGKTVEYVKLANGVEIPKIGYGVFQISKDDAPRCVREAIETGYRHIDTAQSYFNEAEVGQGIKDSGIDRKDLFLTTKIWISNYGYENTLRSVDVSLKKLGTDYLDLVLLHQPFSDTYGAWRALEKLYKDGVIRAFKEAGMEYTIKLIDEYRACGIDGIHLYALNKYEDVTRLVKESGIVDL